MDEPFGIGPIEARAGHCYRARTIIPASGWLAAYEGKDGRTFFNAVACWALVEDADGNQAVVGFEAIDRGLDVCSANANFLGYLRESERRDWERPVGVVAP